MGFRLRWSNHLAKCHVLCWYDGIPRTTCSNQGGFPQWGTREKFPSTPTARTEAYARATVALTRAQQICFIMGPLDMRGLVGAATIIGCLKYGACFSGLDDQDDPVFLIRLKDEDLLKTPHNSACLQSLELVEFIHLWLWWKPTLLRKTVPQGCEGYTLW